MKVLRLTVISSVALVLLLNTAAFGQPSPQVNQPTSASKTAPANNSPQTDDSLCYIQLANGKTVSLSQLCGPQSDSAQPTQSTYSQAPTVYNDSAIKAFDESVYGPEG